MDAQKTVAYVKNDNQIIFLEQYTVFGRGRKKNPFEDLHTFRVTLGWASIFLQIKTKKKKKEKAYYGEWLISRYQISMNITDFSSIS